MRRNDRTTWDTPRLARACFWLYAIGAGAACVMAMLANQWVMPVIYLATIVLAKVWMELIVVVFAIHGVLEEIRNQGAHETQRETIAKQDAARRAALQRQQANEPREMRLG